MTDHTAVGAPPEPLDGATAAALAGRVVGAVGWETSEEADVVLLCARATAHRVAAGSADDAPVLRRQLARLWELRITRHATPGWGLSYAWDSFGKGDENPADTVYAYTTAAAALAFLDGHAVTGDAACLDAAVGACETLLTATCCWRDGPFLSVWYSDRPGDHRPEYQTHNVNALALGALGRTARTTGTDRFAGERTAMVAHLLHSQGRDLGAQRLADGMADVAPSNWRYRSGASRPNDLMHECFIVDGLLESGDPAARAAAVRALGGIWRTHFQGSGRPRDGAYTHGSLGWGVGGGVFALASLPSFRTEAGRAAAVLAGTVDRTGRSSLAPGQPRAQAWFALGLARYAAQAAAATTVLPPDGTGDRGTWA